MTPEQIRSIIVAWAEGEPVDPTELDVAAHLAGYKVIWQKGKAVRLVPGKGKS